MGKTAAQRKPFKVIQGGKAEAVMLRKTLTHKDIKEFLARFAEAILVDQERVNKLPRKKLHPLYDGGMWKRNRECHVDALVELSMTVDKVPKHLLKRLTELAVTYSPEAVRQPLLDIVSDLATRVASPWLYETAPLFFGELIKDVSRQAPNTPPKGSAKEMISNWFDYTDPLRISKDCECEYEDLLASHVQRESQNTKRAQAVRSRYEFVRKRVVFELSDYLEGLMESAEPDL